MAYLTAAGTGNGEPGTVKAGTRDAGPGARPGAASALPAYDVDAIRRQFPILGTRVRGGDVPLVYLDNAATTQKPRAVIDATSRFYAEENANIHRGVHWLSEQATIAYDDVRERVRRFLGAEHAREIIFTGGTTDGINLVASSFGDAFVRPGEEVIVTEMEHHSNLVPWQLMAERRGATLRAVPVTNDGALDLDALGSLLGPRTRLLAVTHVSNALGTVNPIREITALAHARGVPVLVDGAQSASRLPVDVRELDCDFFVCSGHKMYGPTGIGVLYGRADWLERMPPYRGGGDMIDLVTIERTTYAQLPAKFEAGTPNIAGVIGLGAALGWIEAAGRERLERHEDDLVAYAVERLAEVDGLTVIGRPAHRAGLVSFVMDCAHPHDIGTIIDASRGIAIRAGHHCAQPLMARFGLPATARASFAAYNTRDEIDTLVEALREVRRIFHR